VPPAVRARGERPWEAALGASVSVPTPDGEVELTIPPNSAAGRKLRLKGKGIPGSVAGDLYVVLTIVLPPAGVALALDLMDEIDALKASLRRR